MFVEKERSLNESDSKAEYLCRQSLAKAGFAFGEAPATFHWSQLINPMGDKQAALAAYEELLKEEPENKSALEGVAFIYQTLGNYDQSNKYRKTLVEIEAREMGIDLEKNPEAVNFLLAKTGQAPEPERVPASYVGVHFDKYASVFDDQLCGVLKYRGHLIIEEICRQVCKGTNLKALDIGCGTGLTGYSIHDLFSIIDGVDLSDEMLKVADSRKVYSTLTKSDFQNYLSNNRVKYDVITASDVFNYQGDLKETFRLVNNSLNEDGYFIFTVEKGYTETYCLRNTGRFQHNENYIRDLAADHGFSIEEVKEEVLRINDGQNVEAYIFSLKKNKK